MINRLAILLTAAATMVAVATTGHAQRHATSAPPPAAEQILRPPLADLPLIDQGADQWAMVPVRLADQDSVWFIVDLGSELTFLWPKTRVALGDAAHDELQKFHGYAFGGPADVPLTTIDSLRIGALTQKFPLVGILDVMEMLHVKNVGKRPSAGMLGLDILRDYDVEFNVPAGRFRLYPRVDPEDSAGAVIPIAGLTCVPDVSLTRLSSIQATVDGHPVVAGIDPGARQSMLSWEAAALVGLTRESPRLTKSPRWSGGVGGQVDMYQVNGVRLKVGEDSLAVIRVDVGDMGLVNSGAALPRVNLGLAHLRDRTVFLSHSLHQVCFGKPRAARRP